MSSILSERFSHLIKHLRGQARLTETNITEMLREIRLALLEADVALPVVKTLIAEIKNKALGQEVLGSLTPAQTLVGIMHQELIALMSPDDARTSSLSLATQPPAIILMVGLQGVGKTTSTGKLTHWLIEQQNKKVLTVSTDIYRPAAQEQLASVTAQAGGECFTPSSSGQPVSEIARLALDHAKRHFFDVLLVDTAGRLSIDEALMKEVHDLHQQLQPIETLFVVDAMQGQDAFQTAKAFHEQLNLTGIILSKIDGDSRGGAALSARYVTGVPIKFCGSSEKINGLEPFYAERYAKQLLGMGDIVGLFEQMNSAIDTETAQKWTQKIKKGTGFDLQDFLEQMRQMRQMGGIGSLIEKLPSAMTQGMAASFNQDQAEKDFKRKEGIICSMTPKERFTPSIIKASHRRRIAAGAGVQVQEVNRLLNEFEQMQKMMKKMQGGPGLSKMMKKMGGRGLPF